MARSLENLWKDHVWYTCHTRHIDKKTPNFLSWYDEMTKLWPRATSLDHLLVSLILIKIIKAIWLWVYKTTKKRRQMFVLLNECEGGRIFTKFSTLHSTEIIYCNWVIQRLHQHQIIYFLKFHYIDQNGSCRLLLH